MKKNLLILSLTFSFLTIFVFSEQNFYRLPPKDVIDIIDAPRPAVEFLSPDGKYLLITKFDYMRSIEYIAQPFLKLAGMRIFPHNNSQVKTRFYREPVVIRLEDGMTKAVQLPEGTMLGIPIWSFDSRHIAFPRYTDAGVELWVAETKSGKAKDITGPVVNATLSPGYRQVEQSLNASWTPDNRHILVFLTLENRGDPPQKFDAYSGPVIMDTSGRFSRERRWEDMLKNPYDDALFDYYTTAQMFEIDVISDGKRKIGRPGKFILPPSVSPDGNYILINRVKRPHSYWVRYREFARSIEIWNKDGEIVHLLADLPAKDEVTTGKKVARPRFIQWQAHKPSTLIWVESIDKSDQEEKVNYKDRLMNLSAPFKGKPSEILRIRNRYDGLSWLQEEGKALLAEYDGERGWQTTYIVDFNKATSAAHKFFDHGKLDRYNHPGDAFFSSSPKGKRIVVQDGTWIYLSGSGASPEGDRPFLDKINIKTMERSRLFQSGKNSHEAFISFAGESRTQIVISHETKSEPRNFFLLDLKTREKQQLTNFPHPYPQFKGITKQLVKYKRSDGIGLSGTLYLPSGYKKGERLPLVIWAYPREYIHPEIAGQVRIAPNTFTSLKGPSPPYSKIFVTQGYALLDGAEMPVVGHPRTKNDTYIEQIVESARAAIEKLDSMGIIDPERVGMAGHSYGAFSTANLLANSDLFAAGIARSGAHNRTLTPWGFQREPRNVWEAPEFYFKVSPFLHSDKINEPILLLHGEEDDSQASKPIQSHRMYHALRGHGATARLVLLPYENHRYVARESILHVAAEMIEWFDRFVKNKGKQETTKK